MKQTIERALIGLAAIALTGWSACAAEAVRGTEQEIPANRVAEVTLTSDKSYQDPFVDVELDVIFTQPDGTMRKAPAFWAGGNQWKFRYASSVAGMHSWKTDCSDKSNPKLHGVDGKIKVSAAAGDNPLYRHGPIRVAKDQRHFEHADGTPFFWLGDTWWKGLCKRMTWEGFQELTADRKAKGFSVVQIVCGPYPDEPLFGSSWENEGGKPYLDKKFTIVNPHYFEFADRRIKHLVDAGILPAIVGGWGRGDCNSMAMVGLDGIKRHWRNLVARFGAYPTAWIVGGESGGPLWTEAAQYVKSLDASGRALSVHPPDSARRRVTDETAINFDMLQTGHGDMSSGISAIPQLKTARDRNPPMPVVIGEFCYEGHMQCGYQDVQRYVFWASMLSGAAGLTYGAAGVWHASVDGDPGVNCQAFPNQVDPNKATVFDWTTWKEGMNFPGSTQLGLGKKLLERYPWWRFELHPEWVEQGCFAAGIPREVRLIFKPKGKIYSWSGPKVRNLEPDLNWHIYYFDPVTGRKFDEGTIKSIVKTGNKEMKSIEVKKSMPSPQDWVLVLEAIR